MNETSNFYIENENLFHGQKVNNPNRSIDRLLSYIKNFSMLQYYLQLYSIQNPFFTKSISFSMQMPLLPFAESWFEK